MQRPGHSGRSQLPEVREDHPPPASTVQGQRVLFVGAHQDDELFILSRLRTHQLAGGELFLLWTALSTQVNPRYAERRVAESIAVAGELEVPEHNCTFLGSEDGRTDEDIAAILDDLWEVVTRIQPDVVYVPAYEGGHIDHDTANLAVTTVLGHLDPTPSAFEFPLYSTHDAYPMLPFRLRSYPPSVPTHVRQLDDEEYGFVRRCWRYYRSQRRVFGLVLNAHGIRAILGYEHVRTLRKGDFHALPASGSVAYPKFLKGRNYEDFVAAVEAAEAWRPPEAAIPGG